MAKDKKKKEKKTKAQQKIEDEKIQKIMKRLSSEDSGKERISVTARLISAPPNQEGVNVRIRLQVLDRSFYAKGAKILYNAGGAEKFDDIDMDKVDADIYGTANHYTIVLSNIPREIQILYYVKILDKSGEWTQFPRPELIDTDGINEEEPYYSFTVEPDGSIKFKELWEDSSLVDCRVCGYACSKLWDICPECKSALTDVDGFQEVFLADQKAKEEARKKMKEDADLAWDDVSDESWRGLPDCPSCGYTVQLEWNKCPVCDFDLKTVELEKKESYEEFMTEEEREEAEKERKLQKLKKKGPKGLKEEEPEEPEWDAEEGVDIL